MLEGSAPVSSRRTREALEAMRFQIGRHYTREEIHSELGGGLTEFLPHREGSVVAGCFNPAVNPEAPEVVVVGSRSNAQRWAQVFAEQDHPVPVFLKDEVNRWRFVGVYRVRRRVDDPGEMAAHAAAGAVDSPGCLLELERVPDAEPTPRVRSAAAWAVVAAVAGVAGAGAGLLVERSVRGGAFGAGFGAALGLGIRAAWRGQVLPRRQALRLR
jgi:hypothetical protein